MKKVKAIFAIGLDGEFSTGSGEMPWGTKPIRGDAAHFKNYTDGQVLIMGRKTFESLDSPLKDRINIVLTNQEEKPIHTKDFSEPDMAFCKGTVKDYLEEIMEGIEAEHGYVGDYIFIGGMKIIEESLPLLDEISISFITHRDTTSNRINTKSFFEKLAKLGFVIYSETTYNNYLYHEKDVEVIIYRKIKVH